MQMAIGQVTTGPAPAPQPHPPPTHSLEPFDTHPHPDPINQPSPGWVNPQLQPASLHHACIPAQARTHIRTRKARHRYILTHADTQMHRYTDTQIHTRRYTNVRTDAHARARVHTQAFTHKNTNPDTGAYKNLDTHTCIHARTDTQNSPPACSRSDREWNILNAACRKGLMCSH